MDTLEVDECFRVAKELVEEAGKVVCQAINKNKEIEIKSSRVDLVTESDKAVEKLLIEGLTKAFPGHKFIGEETVSEGGKCVLTNDPTWIIDPIDGTMNFVHTLPYTCISVGLWADKEAVLGIVFNPVLKQMFTAVRGGGAFLNGEKIKVSGQKELSQALVFAEMGTCLDKDKMDTVLANITTLMPKVHGIRAMGSCALNMCATAAGWSEVTYEYGIHAWDTAAAAVVVAEAGGVVVDTMGGPFDLMRRRVLCAATPELASEVCKLLKQYQPTPDGELMH